MLHLLDKYQNQDVFTFSLDDRLSQVCNAPDDSSGLYIIFIESEDFENIIYIGISGRQEGRNIIHRADGLYGRIVKGSNCG